MCLAIYKPKGKVVKRAWLRNGFNNNPDGAGFAWSDGAAVHIEKGFFNHEDFWNAYKAHMKDAAVVHFRQATHGAVNQSNCHPWPLLDGKYALVHNGILNIQSTKDLSDTGHFVGLVLEPVIAKVGLDHPALLYLVEQAIGHSNKMAILKPDGSAVLFHEKEGFWVNGIWFSNKSYDSDYYGMTWHPKGRGAQSFGKDFGMGDWERSGSWPDEWENHQNEAAIDEDEAKYYESLGFSKDQAQELSSLDQGKIDRE